MLDGINGAANRVNGGDLLDGGVNVDDDVDLGNRCCCEKDVVRFVYSFLDGKKVAFFNWDCGSPAPPYLLHSLQIDHTFPGWYNPKSSTLIVIKFLVAWFPPQTEPFFRLVFTGCIYGNADRSTVV
ncbi:hypothetical protein V6N12_027165 [Hibiscus sabdariffa]|uniref:Uncharacterized protein n=1 Tax=Hibiscus sabdariffa TaxID=183260 RepID=A0ABR2DVL5_9ROSI